MYSRILVPTDGSELSDACIEGAAQFAKPLGAEVVVMTCVEPQSYNSLSEFRPDASEKDRDQANEMLESARRVFEQAGVSVETIAVKSFSPAQAIMDTVEAKNCDCIFMASHGRKGIAAVLLGSETQKILTHSKVPVMVYR